MKRFLKIIALGVGGLLALVVAGIVLPLGGGIGQGLVQYFFKTAVDGPGVNAPVVVNGLAVFSNDASNLFAVDTKTGKLRWKRETKDVGAFEVDDGLVYTSGPDNERMHVIDLQTGKLKDASVIDTGALALRKFGNLLAFCNLSPSGEYIEVHDARTGKMLWRRNLKDVQPSMQLSSNSENLYVGTMDAFYAFNVATGKQRWKLAIGGSPVAASSLYRNTLFVGAAPGYVGEDLGGLYAVNPENGKIQWRFNNPEGAGAPALNNGTIYFTGGSTFYSVDVATGKEKWSYTTDPIYASLTDLRYADGMVFSLSAYQGGDKTLYAIDAKTGKERWRLTVPGSDNDDMTPTVADGRVFIGSYGKLSTFDAKTGKPGWEFKVPR